jgi:dihydroxyacetone kinase
MTQAASAGLAVAERLVVAMSNALEGASEELCELDASAGDGDHGLAMAAAAKSIRSEISKHRPADLAGLVDLVAGQFGAVGGAMGALTYVLVQALREAAAESKAHLSAFEIARVLAVAEETVSAFGGARRGDKTIVDAIAAAREAAENSARVGRSPGQTLLDAAAAARKGASSTAEMVARIGRASRLGELSRGTVDPGARSFAIALNALADAYAAEGGVLSSSSTASRSSGSR